MTGPAVSPDEGSGTDPWVDLRWFVVFNGIADRWLWGFDADSWRLRHGDPANGTLGVLPTAGGPLATMDDALWLADVFAFDHDAPVGIQPAYDGEWPNMVPMDPAGVPTVVPVQPPGPVDSFYYWQNLNTSYGSAAEMRFNGSYVIRYDDDDDGSPSTDFAARFRGREDLVGLYAMAARQAEILSEYLCLYRVLEAADGSNGKTFATSALGDIPIRDFGDLRIIGMDSSYGTGVNAFEQYRSKAVAELARLATEGVTDVPAYLYRIRNSLAHGKRNTLHARRREGFERAVRALPVVKLLARLAVEP